MLSYATHSMQTTRMQINLPEHEDHVLSQKCWATKSDRTGGFLQKLTSFCLLYFFTFQPSVDYAQRFSTGEPQIHPNSAGSVSCSSAERIPHPISVHAFQVKLDDELFGSTAFKQFASYQKSVCDPENKSLQNNVSYLDETLPLCFSFSRDFTSISSRCQTLRTSQ